MHVATLCDLHGNLRALEAVLHEIAAEATIVVGGDVCAGGIYPSETLERMIAPMVEAGMARCARCGELIEPGTPWDLGHVDGTERKVYSGPEHRRCNRQTTYHRLRKGEPAVVAATPGLILGFRRARVRDKSAGVGPERGFGGNHCAPSAAD